MTNFNQKNNLALKIATYKSNSIPKYTFIEGSQVQKPTLKIPILKKQGY
jgi:hypothetical protein